MTYQYGGALILAIGLLFMIGSMPMIRVVPRSHGILALVGSGVVNWMARGIGAELKILGAVTMLQI